MYNRFVTAYLCTQQGCKDNDEPSTRLIRSFVWAKDNTFAAQILLMKHLLQTLPPVKPVITDTYCHLANCKYACQFSVFTTSYSQIKKKKIIKNTAYDFTIPTGIADLSSMTLQQGNSMGGWGQPSCALAHSSFLPSPCLSRHLFRAGSTPAELTE